MEGEKKNDIQKDDDERRVVGDELEDDGGRETSLSVKLTIVCLSDFVYTVTYTQASGFCRFPATGSAWLHHFIQVRVCIDTDTMRPGFLVCIRYDEIGPSSSVLPVDVRFAWLSFQSISSFFQSRFWCVCLFVLFQFSISFLILFQDSPIFSHNIYSAVLICIDMMRPG